MQANKTKPYQKALVISLMLLLNPAQSPAFDFGLKSNDEETPLEDKPPANANPTAAAPKKKPPPPDIEPYQIPTFTGDPVDYKKIKPAINPKRKIDGDVIFKIINTCYPLKSGFGLEISLRSGLNYKDKNQASTTLQTYDSQNYYAGIVANMPLYSDLEIDKDRKLEYQRRTQTASTIKELLAAVAQKRRAERLMGLYLARRKDSCVNV